MENISRFILNRSAAHVKRYHTTPMFAQESVAEHSHAVAMITRIICHVLTEAGRAVDTLRAVDLALIHDYEEAISGDIISPFKHSDAELLELLDRLNAKTIDDMSGLKKNITGRKTRSTVESNTVPNSCPIRKPRILHIWLVL